MNERSEKQLRLLQFLERRKKTLTRITHEARVSALERLKLAAEAANIGTWILKLPSKDLEWCARCKEIFGIPLLSDFRYEDFLERVYAEDRNRVDGIVQRSIDPGGGGPYDIEYRIVRPSGEVRWVAAKGKAYFEGVKGRKHAVRFVGTLLDRTELKYVQGLLLQSEKLATTGRLAASIAHEIRNPLDAVSNLLYLVREEECREKRLQHLDTVMGELQRVTDIAMHTLQLTRDPVGINKVNLGALIESTLALFHGRIAAQRITVLRRVLKGVSVEASEGELRQVVVNLVSNALDAMPAGGKLLLRINRLDTSYSGGQKVRLTVADSGNGMTQDVLSRICEAFYTTKGNSGNGIGLWLSMEILRKYNAELRVKSSPGLGTICTILFPTH